MIGGKPPNPHFNSWFLNQPCIKIVVGDSAVLPELQWHSHNHINSLYTQVIHDIKLFLAETNTLYIKLASLEGVTNSGVYTIYVSHV